MRRESPRQSQAMIALFLFRGRVLEKKAEAVVFFLSKALYQIKSRYCYSKSNKSFSA
jgi:hypothetical protein